MEKKYKLVIWDVDGTLLDTGKGLCESVKEMARRNNMMSPPEDILRTFVGPPIHDSLKKYYKLNELEANRLTQEFRDIYKLPEYLLMANVYPGIKELMNSLNVLGHKQAIATYKRQDYAERIVDYFGLSGYCDIVKGADFEGKLKKTDIIQICIDYFRNYISIENSEIVMIGDTEHDKIGAENIGISFIPVAYGYGFTEGCRDTEEIAEKLTINS